MKRDKTPVDARLRGRFEIVMDPAPADEITMWEVSRHYLVGVGISIVARYARLEDAFRGIDRSMTTRAESDDPMGFHDGYSGPTLRPDGAFMWKLGYGPYANLAGVLPSEIMLRPRVVVGAGGAAR